MIRTPVPLLLAALLALPASATILDAPPAPDAGTPAPVPAAPIATEPAPAATAPPPAPEPAGTDPCLAIDDARDADREGVAFKISVGGAEQPITQIRIRGLHEVQEDRLWALVLSRRPGTLDFAQASRLVRRLVDTGLFQEVKPSLIPSAGVDAQGRPTAALEIALTEYPVVRQVVVQGVTEERPEVVIDSLFSVPFRGWDRRESRKRGWSREEKDSDREWRWNWIGAKEDVEDWWARNDGKDRCHEARPPVEWLARTHDGILEPGIAWRGIAPGLERLQAELEERGYLLASVEAELSAAGVLAVKVNEGRVGVVKLEGVDPSLQPEVQHLLGVEAGQVFLVDDLEHGIERVERRFPFLRGSTERHGFDGPHRIAEETTTDGAVHFRSVAGRPEKEARVHVRWGDHDHELSFHFPSWPWSDDDDGHRPRPGVSVREEALVIGFERRRSDDLDWRELLRHTQVTGFAPGLSGVVRVWDPKDQVHLAFGAALNLNTRVPDPALVPDFTAAISMQAPRIGLAELGLIAGTRFDTADGWRVDPLDSYLNSMVFNRPEREYFHRSVLGAFATFHIAERVTLGVEYRLTEDASAVTTPVAVSIFNRADGAFPNPAIEDGRSGSLLGRFEFSTEAAPLSRVGTLRRAPEEPLVQRPFFRTLRTGFTTVNTVEVANPSLRPRFEGDEDATLFRFVRFVSDNHLHLRTAHDQGLRFRLRVAGGRGLPLQEQEALGGWGALRGYGFKEFRDADYSVLGSAEYQFGLLSGFADLGTVRQERQWLTPRLGLGLGFNLGDTVQIAAAWRADAGFHAMPELRFTLRPGWL